MTDAPSALTLDRVLASCRTVRAAHLTDYSHAVVILMEEIRHLSGASACVLTERLPQGARSPDVVASDSPGSLLDPALVIDFAIPIDDASGDRVLGEVKILVQRGKPIIGAQREIAEFLASGLASLVFREHARREASTRAAQSDAALLDTLTTVRSAEDRIGNSIGVVLGWLRVAQDGVQQTHDLPEGLTTAMRRLQDTQNGVMEFLRLTQTQAIRRQASDPVDVSRLLPGVDVPGGSWILANRTHLASLLSRTPPVADSTSSWSSETWTLGLVVPITSELMTAIAAAGGTIDVSNHGATAWWPRWSGG